MTDSAKQTEVTPRSGQRAAMLVALIIGLVVLAFLWNQYGWRPALSAEGRVLALATDEPVQDAYVVLDLVASRGTFAHGANSCARGSAVVRTDAEGRFAYRVAASEALRRPYPDSWGFAIRAYHPDYGMSRRPNGGTEPLYYESGTAELQLGPAGVSRWDDLWEIGAAMSGGCFTMSVDHGHAAMSRDLYEAAHALYCTDAGRAIPLVRAQAFLEARLREIASHVAPGQTEVDRNEASTQRTQRVRSSIAPQAMSATGTNPVDDETERVAFCAYYAPPADRVLGASP